MSHVLCETDGNGTITAYYIHGPQIVARVSNDGSQRYYHTDAIGNVAALTNETGTVTDRYAYEPFGVPAGREGSTPNPFTFVGGLGVMAEADGLYFMRSRFYDSQTGRFTNKDPVSGIVESPLTFHSYVYANNQPKTFVDPAGEATGTARLLAGEVGGLIDMTLWGGTEIGSEVGAWWLYAHGKISGAEFARRVMNKDEFRERLAKEYFKGFVKGAVLGPVEVGYKRGGYYALKNGQYFSMPISP